MATARGTRRRAASAAIDEALLDSGLKQIRRVGPDGLSVSLVAKGAGVTTGAFYSRYENAYELLLDVWKQRCAGNVGHLLVSAAEPGELAEALKQRDPALAVGLALIIVSPRVPELSEDLLPQVNRWFGEVGENLVPVAFALGATLFDAIESAPERDWATPLTWVDRAVAPARREVRDGAVGDFEQLLNVDTGDQVRDRLLLAAARVIGRGGLQRATTSRIARAAGFTQAAVFGIWRTRDDMLAEVTEVILAGLTRAAAPFGLAAMSGDARGAADGVTEILGPGYEEARRLRLEMLLAATSSPVVAAPMVASDLAASAVLARVPGVDVVRLQVLADAVRAVVLGLTLIQHVTGDLDGLDFEPVFADLLGRAR